MTARWCQRAAAKAAVLPCLDQLAPRVERLGMIGRGRAAGKCHKPGGDSDTDPVWRTTRASSPKASSGFNAFFTPMSPRLSQMASATGQVDNGSHASGS